MAAPSEKFSLEKGKRERSVNFSLVEKHLLVDLVDSELGILRSKFSSNVTAQMKRDIWEKIGKKVSALGVAQRSAIAVKEGSSAAVPGCCASISAVACAS